MAEIKRRAPINRVIKKNNMLSISKKDFLIGLGISNLVVDKLLKLEFEGENAFCIIRSGCEGGNCNGDTAKVGISADVVKSLIDQDLLTENDMDKDLLKKIRM